jgi:hypothetical protein
MGWLMFKLKPLPPFDNVADLRKDPLVAWQHRYIHLIAVGLYLNRRLRSQEIHDFKCKGFTILTGVAVLCNVKI